MSSNKKSVVWNHFKLGKDPNMSNCNLCSQAINCKLGNTTTMKRHLLTVHLIDITKPPAEGPLLKKQRTLDSFAKKTSLAEIVSKYAAVDGFSIRAITNSEGIRNGLSLQGFALPQSETTVMTIIKDFAGSKKIEVMDELRDEIDKGLKFSITLDEWTSSATRRYLNINLHKSDLSNINLGLLRIRGSCNADKMVELVKNHLKSFNVSFKHDIVAATGDGANVMLSFGVKSPVIYQVCLNHGLHLGVFHTFYKKKAIAIENKEESDTDEEDDFEESREVEGNDDELDYITDIGQTIDSVRKIVKFFKVSTVRRDLFASKVKSRYNTNEQLSLDCPTRWNSMLFMLEKFLRLHEAVEETLYALGSEYLLQRVDLNFIRSLVECLKPVEVAARALGEAKATLRTADIAITFMLAKLKDQSNDISRTLQANLEKYIEKRLYTKIMELHKLLNYADGIPTKAILEFAAELLHRLFSQNEVSNIQEPLRKEIIEPAATLDEELRQLLDEGNSYQEQCPGSFTNLKQEFALFKLTGKRTENLNCLLKAINTIQPTSIDAERTFSVANNFCTKIRNRLSDESVSTLVFLKYYFLRKQSK